MKKLLALMLALVMVFALAACGSEPAAEESPAAAESEAPAAESETPAESEAPAEETVEPVTLNIGYMNNYGSLWSVLAADQMGYFEEQGITVNLLSFADGPTIISAMESGSIDLGYIGDGAHKLCVLGNAEVIALSHISNGDAVIGGPNVTSLEELEGKVVAYAAGTSSETILTQALSSVGLTMDDITAMNMDASAIVTAMLTGDVDACALWSPRA